VSSWFGIYGLGMYNQLTEGNFIGRGDDSSDTQQDVYSTEVSASFTQMSLGITLQPINLNYLALQVIIGPTFTQANASQRVTQQHPANPDDFIMKLSPSVMGAIVGVQLGFRFFDNFALNPYYTVSVPLDETCASYTTEVTVYGDLFDLSDPNCGESQSGQDTKVEYDTAFEVLGLNVVFPSWGLSFNIYSELSEIQGIEGTKPTLYSFTWSY
jgi:hypothetical protein